MPWVGRRCPNPARWFLVFFLAPQSTEKSQVSSQVSSEGGTANTGVFAPEFSQLPGHAGAFFEEQKEEFQSLQCEYLGGFEEVGAGILQIHFFLKYQYPKKKSFSSSFYLLE